MSSYLFVLVMEAFSRLLHKRVGEDQDFLFHWRCSKTKLTHLCFADDLMLFCGNSIHSAKVFVKQFQTSLDYQAYAQIDSKVHYI